MSIRVDVRRYDAAANTVTLAVSRSGENRPREYELHIGDRLSLADLHDVDWENVRRSRVGEPPVNDGSGLDGVWQGSDR